MYMYINNYFKTSYRNVVSESDVYAPLSTTKLKTIEFKDDKDLWEQVKDNCTNNLLSNN